MPFHQNRELLRNMYDLWLRRQRPKPFRHVKYRRSVKQRRKTLHTTRGIETGMWHNDKCKEYIPASGELCVIGKLILRGTKIVIPRKLRAQVLTLAHESYPGIMSMKQRLRTKVC